jgi:hypothetical protein
MESICSSETSVETERTTRRHIPEDDTLEVASFSSETLVDTQRTTERYTAEDGTLRNHRCENLKSYNFLLLLGDKSLTYSNRSSFLKLLRHAEVVVWGAMLSQILSLSEYRKTRTHRFYAHVIRTKPPRGRHKQERPVFCPVAVKPHSVLFSKGLFTAHRNYFCFCIRHLLHTAV